MTPSFTDRLIRGAARMVPPRYRQVWRREWEAELSYGWQRLGRQPTMNLRWHLTARASSAIAHAGWLRAQEITVDHLLHDARIALRLLRRHPAASLVAVVTLALGIGANTAIFSLVNTVLFEPLPVSGLDRLVVVKEDLPGLNLLDVDLAPAEVTDLAARDDIFEGVTGLQLGDRTLTEFGEPQRVGTVATVGDFRGVFGVVPAAGRMFGPEQSTEGPATVAVVSHALWQRLSGGDPGFVGSTLLLNDVSHEVVGVMPEGFRYPRGVDVWVPFQMTDRWRENRGSLFMTTVGRMSPGMTGTQLAAGLENEVGAWNETYHVGGEGKRLSATSFVEYLAGPLRLILLVLLGAVVFVLMIAASNVASLQLVRTMGRSREIAVRSAIGATPGRIFRQFLLESVIIASAGGVLGLAIGLAALRLLDGWGPASELHLSGAGLDGSVLAFTAGVTMLAAVVFGTVPAIRGASVSPDGVLREQGRGLSTGLSGQRLLKASVVVQVALALVLLLGSGLMIRTLSRLLDADPGFRPEGVVTASVSVPSARYNDSPTRLAFFDALLDRVQQLPGVHSAALVTGLPFAGGNDSSPFDIPGRPSREGGPQRHAEATIVTPDYFESMGIPLVAGHGFDGTERPGTPTVAVVDETFARQFFPDEDAVGQVITGYFGSETRIIGVAGVVDHDEIGDAPKALVYYSASHQPWMTARSIVVRSDLPVGDVDASLRSALASLDPTVPLDDVQTMEGRIERSLGPRRVAMLALGGFSLLALLLAALGVYGVMRHATGQRVREIGVRMALGARPGEVVGLVVRQGLLLAIFGVVTGTAVAFVSTQLMEGMLFGVTARDPVTFAVGAVVLVGVTVAASLMPALSAARVDPVSVLRAD